MTIQIDSREHKWELARIQRQLTALGCKTIVSKLYVGDYQSLDNPRLVIDRKKICKRFAGTSLNSMNASSGNYSGHRKQKYSSLS